MAEAVLKHQISQRESLKGVITVDSAGTGAYHEGDGADERYVGAPSRLICLGQ
jgi:low molecular weight phosphotyrosine protein phosphatase